MLKFLEKLLKKNKSKKGLWPLDRLIGTQQDHILPPDSDFLLKPFHHGVTFRAVITSYIVKLQLFTLDQWLHMKLMWLNVSLLVITKTNIFFIAKISSESDNNEHVIWLEALLLIYACNETIGKNICLFMKEKSFSA